MFELDIQCTALEIKQEKNESQSIARSSANESVILLCLISIFNIAYTYFRHKYSDDIRTHRQTFGQIIARSKKEHQNEKKKKKRKKNYISTLKLALRREARGGMVRGVVKKQNDRIENGDAK